MDNEVSDRCFTIRRSSRTKQVLEQAEKATKFFNTYRRRETKRRNEQKQNQKDVSIQNDFPFRISFVAVCTCSVQ